MTKDELLKVQGKPVIDSGGGFLIEEDVDLEEEMLKIAEVPAPIIVEVPKCEECRKDFKDSYLLQAFDISVCDSCRDNDDKHSLITKTEAKQEYLLKDCDFDKREPPLKYIIRKNPHNPRWGEMKLYLHLQVEKRALEVWGSEENLIKEKQQRSVKKEETKIKKFNEKVPTSADEWIRIASDFANIWNFPHCVGALDGKHVVIQAAPCSGSHYYNYKGTHSIVLMALADANYKLIYVNIGCNGRVSDGGVFNRCALSAALEENTINLPPPEPLPGRYKPSPYVIVADDAFAMKPYLLKPFSFQNQPAPNRIFSYRLSRARRVIENVFGIMATRFRILRRPIQLCPAKVKKVVGAICVLHNFLISRKTSRGNYAPPLIFDTENPDGTITEGTWRQEGLPVNNLLPMDQHGHNFSQHAKSIREEFRDYFMSSEGEVHWQYKCI